MFHGFVFDYLNGIELAEDNQLLQVPSDSIACFKALATRLKLIL